MNSGPYKLIAPPEPEYTRSIRVAIITDLGASDPDEERDMIADQLGDYLEANVSVVASGRSMSAVTLKTFDILVLDYGGASIHGTDNLAGWEIRAACEWAENHPGRVLLLWTTFTALEYGHELEAEFGHLDNVMVRFGTKPWNCWGDGEAVFDDIKKWFWPLS